MKGFESGEYQACGSERVVRWGKDGKGSKVGKVCFGEF